MTATAPTGLAWAPIAEVDPELWAAMVGERHRQHDKIELIASENYVYAAVLEAQGSWLTNKYAEGLPGKRYYGGCEFVDVVERLAQERALELFPGAEHVNVQPHSGAQANMAAYMSTVNPGDRVLGMKLDQGGHLTHGMALNFSGRYFEIHGYGVRRGRRADRLRRARAAGPRGPPEADHRRRQRLSADHRLRADGRHRPLGRGAPVGRHGPHRRARRGRPPPEPVPARGPRHDDDPQDPPRRARRADLRPARAARRRVDPADYPMVKPNLAATIDRSVFPGVQGGPLEHVIAGKAVGFKLALSDEFRDYQRQVLANARAMAETLEPEGGMRLISGGTDNHLILVDVTPFGVTGREAEHLLDEIGITVNKNGIPFDANPPNTASGIRIGTPATTSRGFGEDEMRVDRPDHRRGHPSPRRAGGPGDASPTRSPRSSTGSRSRA